MGFIEELKRRKVFKVAVAYVVVTWLLIQVGDTLFPTFGAPEWVLRIFSIVLFLGFPGLRPGDQWCLCAARWQEALEAGAPPMVVLESTHAACLRRVKLADLKRYAVDLV